ncbi:kinase-like protein [Periconia macrospinosa]|uniref:Kinase-like protein n=1 Tax=Periconia macrospinosa TaxID=97972 RepID=A0A2V1EE06_9PLEO|nr:kinase-like protein [Periconia macrospinosa]
MKDSTRTLIDTMDNRLSLELQKRLFEENQKRQAELADEELAIESPQSFYTATPGTSAALSPQQPPTTTTTTTEYGEWIAQKELQVAKEVELDWSGRGQHVEYDIQEHVPLTAVNVLGYSATALVESVECRRILLARKSIQLNRRVKLADVIGEVEHLHRLRHRHVIRFVGSYLQGRTFAMLLYPTADSHLGTYMDNLSYQVSLFPDYTHTRLALARLENAFLCLTEALAYIHSQGIKHLDIKPSNILISKNYSPHDPLKIYITDFGISREFTAEEGSETDTPTARTPKWASPEIIANEQYGRASDIFSLGCVFSEISTVLVAESLDNYRAARASNGGSDAFHSNLPQVYNWLELLRSRGFIGGYMTRNSVDSLLVCVKNMLARDPAQRPTAEHLLEYIKGKRWVRNVLPCGEEGPEPFKLTDHQELVRRLEEYQKKHLSKADET